MLFASLEVPQRPGPIAQNVNLDNSVQEAPRVSDTGEIFKGKRIFKIFFSHYNLTTEH